MRINTKLTVTHNGINQIRQIRTQVNGYMKEVKDRATVDKFRKVTKSVLEMLDKLESTRMQPKSKAMPDALACPIRLNDKLPGVASVVGSAETKPTEGPYVVREAPEKQVNGASRPSRRRMA